MSNYSLPNSDRSNFKPSLFPASYPFELTEKFQAAFGGDKVIVLPSPYRLAYWQTLVGEPAWQLAVEEIDAANEKAKEEYAAEVEKTTAINIQREKANRIAEAHYNLSCEKHNSELAANLILHKHAVDTAQRYVKQRRLRELKNAIEDRSTTTKEMLTQIRDVVDKERRTWKNPRYICCLIAFVACIAVSVISLAVDGSPFLHLFISSGFSFLAFFASVMGMAALFHRFGEVLANYNTTINEEMEVRRRYRFWTDNTSDGPHVVENIHSPAYLIDVACRLGVPPESTNTFKETHPIGRYSDRDLATCEPTESFTLFLGMAISLIPAIGLLYTLTVSCFWKSTATICIPILRVIDKHNRERTMELTEKLMSHFDNSKLLGDLVDRRIKELGDLPGPLISPKRPTFEAMLPIPVLQVMRVPVRPAPPPSCFDTAEELELETVFKGSQIYSRRHVTRLAYAGLLVGDRIRSYFVFGGVPFPISVCSLHFLVVGTTGAGKTTTMLRLLSSLLPLSTSQASRLAQRISNGGMKYPSSSHEWGRSFTHQAIVYNAKGEYLNYIRAFGFDEHVDLFNLDPADPNGYAWDIAADINDRESIPKFTEHLIPMSVAASRDKPTEFWLAAARRVLEAIIISFRNAASVAGKEPAWTLRDLVIAVSSDENIKHIFKWHDTPRLAHDALFGLSESQQSSITMTLRESIGHFTIAGNRWYDAQKKGRSISLKAWARYRARTVLVLPNTKANLPVYGPLNQCLIKALTEIVLQPEYSYYADEEGVRQTHRRLFFIDEQGGQLSELDRLMAEGRAFGVNVVLGVHQLSQLRENYGENGSETIIGLCSFVACLKTKDQRTQKWMSELIGSCVRSYQKLSRTNSTSRGQTLTHSNNTTHGESEGGNSSHSQGRSEGLSDTVGTSQSNSHSKQSSHSSDPMGLSRTNTQGISDTEGETTSASRTVNSSTNEGVTVGTSSQKSKSVTDGVSNATNETENEGTSETNELRGEQAVEPYEFGTFPDPSSTGECEGVYVTPAFPPWRTTLTMDDMEPQFEFPEKLNDKSARRTEEEDELASKSVEWNLDDLTRLGLDIPPGGLDLGKSQCTPDDEPPLSDFNY